MRKRNSEIKYSDLVLLENWFEKKGVRVHADIMTKQDF